MFMSEIASPYQSAPAGTPADFPPQHQETQPGIQQKMDPEPVTENPSYRGSGKLDNRVAVITGGDSGIGQAVAVAFAKEGADVVVAYYNEQNDALMTAEMVHQAGKRCVLVQCDLKQEYNAQMVVENTMQEYGRIDVLVNNIAVQYPQNRIEDITAEQLDETFITNIYSFFYMTKAVMPHLKAGCSIINTTSVTAYEGSANLIDYSATKGAIVSFTRSMALSVAADGIRVNAVAPGPVWTPLIPASFDEQKVSKFGQDVPFARAAQPFELAPTYVYLASDDSAFVTGQVLHVNGGVITGS
jgi:NAD(P)-dependent dehydrogenase (short-subunit alcohol dehydrogenase family)